MSEDRMWDYYQGEGVAFFAQAHARLGYLVDWAARVGPPKPRVLDVGVGNGWIEHEGVRRGWRVSAVDPSPGPIERLRGEGIDAHLGSIAALPFPDAEFDLVFCSEVLEHLEDGDLALGVGELARVLKPTGHLLGSVPYRERLVEALAVCPSCGTLFHRWGHRQSFDQARLRELLAAAGLRLVAVRRRSFPDAGSSWIGQLKCLPHRWLGRLGVAIAAPSLVFLAGR